MKLWDWLRSPQGPARLIPGAGAQARLRELNARLQDTVVEQARTAALLRDSEAQVRRINLELEQRVAERTAELSAANARLTETLAERTAASAALRDSEARLTLAVEAVKLGVWEIDFVRNMGRLDLRAAELSGPNLPAGVWIKLDGPEFAAWVHRIHPEDLPKRAEAARALRAGAADIVQMEYRVRLGDGEDWTWLTHWRSVTDRDPETGAPLRAIGVIQDTTERARVEAELREALTQRDLLLREVYHRVKNNLQVVDGLLMLQLRELEDRRAVEALTDLRSRVYALGLVHSQLMASRNLETFDIAPFLQELTHNVVAGGGPTVALEFECCALEVNLDFAVPLGLLTTELVTNSLKHALPDGEGTLRVTFALNEAGDAVLTVADDGIAPPAAPAPAGGKPGLGASIVSGLVRQLSATLSVHDDGGRVSVVVIPQSEFP